MSDEWNPPVELTAGELKLLKLCRSQKLWSFLRVHRSELLDTEVRLVLRSMYRNGPKGGRPPASPERLALAMLLQVGFGIGDHEVPGLTVADRRWQMVLDWHDEEPAFSQATLFSFRERAREHGLVSLLLDKTVALSRKTAAFDHKRLRVLFDSSPLVGAGRVEDTFNLLGHAIAQLVDFAADATATDPAKLAKELELSVFAASSIKAALDVDWREPKARTSALEALLSQFERLQSWLGKQLDEARLAEPPLADQLALVERIIAQDTEPDPDAPGAGSKKKRIRQGTSQDRLISLSDRDMRHGRKSTTKLFNGYKRHVAVDADVPGLICAVHVMAANRSEHEAAEPLMKSLSERGFQIIELHVDRGYIPAQSIADARAAGIPVISKPPTSPTGELFPKDDFAIDDAAQTVTCPAGVVIPLRLEKTLAFPRARCAPCELRSQCTKRPARQLKLHRNEPWFREMRAELTTPQGRAKRRERIPVEHALARVGAIQGTRAHYKGIDKNLFDLERAAVVGNCFVLNGQLAAA